MRPNPRRFRPIPARPVSAAGARITPALRLAVAGVLALGAIAAPAMGAPFRVQGLFQIGPAHVGVAFSDSVDIGQALQRARYTITPQSGAPTITLRSVALQENQQTVYLSLDETLPPSATYAVTVNGVTSKSGAPLEPGGPSAFTTVAEAVTGIADVHENINDLTGKTVTVIGQVFLTASSSGGTPSAYVQDGTGRGLNVFGSPLQPALDSLGSVAKVTGTVELYFTTVEITSPTATPIATRMPHLAPKALTVAQASSAAWEGTYIRTTATLTAAPSPSGASNYNYPAADGGIAFTFRVRNSTGIDPGAYRSGDVVTGAGAGGAFQSTYQVAVGNAADLYEGPGPGDTTPPVPVEAEGEGGKTSVTVRFSEPLGAGSSNPAHYTVYPSGAPGAPISVAAAAASGATVTLTLAAPLAPGTEYTVEVTDIADPAGNLVPAGASVTFKATEVAEFAVTGVFPFGADYVGVGFSKPVNASEALNLSHYGFSPALGVAAAAIQDNGRTVILETSAPLPASASYSVTVTGITSATGEPLVGTGPFALQTPAQTVTNIAAIQADPAAWSGQQVTVIGQTYIPVGSRGGTPSGYIQDGSGRGINVFGGSVQGPVNALGTLALVTGTVEVYFTTTEITGYTATALATDQPHLGARRLTAAQANSSAWEGTYIETSAALTDIQASGASNYNYTGTDGGASITFRVGNGLGIPPANFAIGDRVTGRGAGGAFQSTFQINVGNLEDFFKAGAGPDTIPPALVAASGAVGETRIRVEFSEQVSSNEATVIANYTVTANPGGSVAITSVVMDATGRAVELAVATPLAAGVSYVVTAANVTDLAGNVIAAGAAVSFTPEEALPARARLRVPPVTLVKNLTGMGEVMQIEIAGLQDAKAVCRVFDLRGRLVRVLFDSRLTGTPRRTVTWDGRDESFEFVPAGLYVCHLETTDTNGHVSEDRAPVVVAVRLR